jgi:hypothetical protein
MLPGKKSQLGVHRSSVIDCVASVLARCLPQATPLPFSQCLEGTNASSMQGTILRKIQRRDIVVITASNLSSFVMLW